MRPVGEFLDGRRIEGLDRDREAGGRDEAPEARCVHIDSATGDDAHAIAIRIVRYKRLVINL